MHSSRQRSIVQSSVLFTQQEFVSPPLHARHPRFQGVTVSKRAILHFIPFPATEGKDTRQVSRVLLTMLDKQEGVLESLESGRAH